jgi:hypothetical protein
MTLARSVVPAYAMLMAELDRRRQLLGLSSLELEDLAGLCSGHFQKGRHPQSRSGRCLSWPLLEALIGALYPTGYRILLHDGAAPPPSGPKRHRLAHAWARAHLATIARLQTKQQRSLARLKIPRRRRKEIARMAARARWDKIHRARERLARIVPASERPSIARKMGDYTPLA